MATRRVSEPVQEAVKAYLELAMGLTEASKKKAEKTVKKVTRELIGKGGATASQLQGMAEDLVNTGMANREAVSRLVRLEMDRALSRLGLATADEVATLQDRVEALERKLREAGVVTPTTIAKAAETVAAVKKAPAKKAVAEVPAAAKKAPAKKTTAKKATKQTAAKTTAAKKAAS